MTTEEIEKAAERFTEERRYKSTGYPPKEWFKAGAEFADKHWQEKTKWIPVEERLPETYPLGGVIGLRVGMQVLTLSHEGSNVAILHDMGNGKPYWMLNSGKELHGVTYWKEIE